MGLRARLTAYLRGSLAVDAPRPEWGAGLRAATAMMLPLALGWALQRPEMVWVALGGWLGMLSDPGGPYPARAAAMGTFALAGALATALGGLAGDAPAIALPALFLVALVCSLSRVRGDTAGVIGVLALTMFCITQGSPAPWDVCADRGLLFAGGALFALLLSLSLWPFRPYLPVRAAMAECWERLSGLVQSAARLGESAQPGDWDRLFASRKIAREALERARAALGAARAGRQGETGRGMQLLVLYEIAELTLGDVAALSEVLRFASEEGDRVEPSILRGLHALSRIQAALAEAVVDRPAELERVLSDPEALPRLPQAAGQGDAAAFLARIDAETRQSVEAVRALNGAGKGPRWTASVPAQDQGPRLRDALALESIELRHALRVAIVATCAAALAAALHLHRSYWVTMTVVIVLQPHAVATVRRVLQRVGGTVVGGMAAALIARAAHTPLLVSPILFGLSWIAIAVRRMNYAAFAALLTPVFVLLAETTAGDWHLTGVRVLNTVLGGTLALLGALTLWPTRELERMPALLSALLRADLGYLRAVLRRQSPSEVIAARRQVGLATANAEAALQRLIGEGSPASRTEPLMALVAYARRLSASITALGASPPAPEEAARLEQTLAALADAAQKAEVPPPVPELPSAPQLSAAQRVLRQLRVVHSALARVAAR